MAPIALPLSLAGNGALKITLDARTGIAEPDAGFVNRSILSTVAPGSGNIPPSTVSSGPVSTLRSNDAPDIFGSVAMLVRHTALDSKWRSVAHAALGRGPWSGLIRAASSMHSTDQLEAVNHWVNAHIRFTSDGAGQTQGDDWAGAARSLRSGRGDCEDYAIAKMQILRAMGFNDDDLYLVIARDLVRRADHAVLAVRTAGKLVVLDNETDAVLDGAAAQDYRPIFSFSGNRSWIHGYRQEETAPVLASQAVPSPIQLASR
jgi:predicted transglutaminase-like cysteine proteinase